MRFWKKDHGTDEWKSGNTTLTLVHRFVYIKMDHEQNVFHNS